MLHAKYSLDTAVYWEKRDEKRTNNGFIPYVSEGMSLAKMILIAFFNICFTLKVFKFITSVVITGLIPAVLGGKLLYMTAVSMVI